jgi:hypothetical protein
LSLGRNGTRIPKCTITGCPNNKSMLATTFKAYIQSHNIKYRNQPIPVLHQNEPYVYLGIQLIPSLKWKTQQATIMNKVQQTHKTNTTTTKFPNHTKTKIKNGRYSNQTGDCLQLLCSTIFYAKHS